MKKPAQIGIINDVSEDEILDALHLMERDSHYLTKDFYRGTSERWTNNHISFVEYHINYLKSHPTLNPEQYISNLRLMLRKTPR